MLSAMAGVARNIVNTMLNTLALTKPFGAPSVFTKSRSKLSPAQTPILQYFVEHFIAGAVYVHEKYLCPSILIAPGNKILLAS